MEAYDELGFAIDIGDLCYWIRRFKPEYSYEYLDTLTSEEVLKLYLELA